MSSHVRPYHYLSIFSQFSAPPVTNKNSYVIAWDFPPNYFKRLCVNCEMLVRLPPPKLLLRGWQCNIFPVFSTNIHQPRKSNLLSNLQTSKFYHSFARVVQCNNHYFFLLHVQLSYAPLCSSVGWSIWSVTLVSMPWQPIRHEQARSWTEHPFAYTRCALMRLIRVNGIFVDLKRVCTCHLW